MKIEDKKIIKRLEQEAIEIWEKEAQYDEEQPWSNSNWPSFQKEDFIFDYIANMYENEKRKQNKNICSSSL